MRASWVPVLLLAGAASLGAAHATGFGGSDAPTRIPVPARVFRATVEDVSGTVVEVSRVTFDGEVHVVGRVGEGQAAVHFERIAELTVEPTGDDGTRIVYVKLRDAAPGEAERVKVVVDHDVPCYAEAAFGNYRIDVERIRRVTFHHDGAAASPTGRR